MQHANQLDLPDSGKPRKLIGHYLIEANLITEQHLFQALEKQKTSPARIGDILVEQDSIDRKTLDYFVAKIIRPEQAKDLQQNLLLNRSQDTIADNSFKAFERGNKALNLNAIELSPTKVFTVLLFIVFFLVLAGILVYANSSYIERSASINYAARLFRLDEENNFPTLYSGLALGFSSILLFIISNIKKKTKSGFAKQWRTLSLIFLYLAIDELVSIHEILNFLRPIVNARGLLYFAWVIPGIVLVTIFVLAYWKFIQSLPKTTKRLFILAGAIYVGGAIGVEMLGGYYTGVSGSESLIYSLVSTIEEFLEMFGILIFIYALLSYITRYIEVANLQVNFVADKKLKKVRKS